MALNMCDKKIIIFLGRFFVITLLIRPWPGDFLIGSCFIMFSISPGEVFLAESDMGRGELRELSTISSCDALG
jgi:hypothetical protein